MDTRRPGDKLDQAIAAAHQDGPPELKLARLEAAVCEPGVRDVLKHDPRRLAAYQSAYSSCADALANELSVLNRHIYAQIDNLDNVEVKKQKYGYRIPLSHRMVTTSFNMLAQHVSRSIVSEENIDRRTMIMERWINIAQRCFNEKDFNTCFAIMAGLGSTPVFRLKATNDGLSGNAVRFLEIFRPLLANADATTMLMSRTGTDIIPYYGTYRTALTFILDKIDSAQRKKDMPALQAEQSARDQLITSLERIKVYQNSIDTIRQAKDMSPLQAMLLRKTMVQIMKEIAEEKSMAEEEIRRAEADIRQLEEEFASEKGPYQSYLKAKTEYEKSKKDDKATQAWEEEKQKFDAAKKKIEAAQKSRLGLVQKRDAILEIYKRHEEVLKASLKDVVVVERALVEPESDKSAKIKKMEIQLPLDKIDDALSIEAEPRNQQITSSTLFTDFESLINPGISQRINEASLIIDCVNIMKESSTTTNSMRGNNIKIAGICSAMTPGEIQQDLSRLNDEIEQVRLFVLDAKRNIERHLAGGHKMHKDEKLIDQILEKLQTEYLRLNSMLSALESNAKRVSQKFPGGEPWDILRENIQHIEKLHEVFASLSDPLSELTSARPAVPIDHAHVRRPLTMRLNEPLAFPAWLNLEQESEPSSMITSADTQSADSLLSEAAVETRKLKRDQTRRHAVNLSETLASQGSPIVRSTQDQAPTASASKPSRSEEAAATSPQIPRRTARKYPAFAPPVLPRHHEPKTHEPSPQETPANASQAAKGPMTLIDELRKKQADISAKNQQRPSTPPPRPPRKDSSGK